LGGQGVRGSHLVESQEEPAGVTDHEDEDDGCKDDGQAVFGGVAAGAAERCTRIFIPIGIEYIDPALNNRRMTPASQRLKELNWCN
jgi:hypothetical protein